LAELGDMFGSGETKAKTGEDPEHADCGLDHSQFAKDRFAQHSGHKN
jgi:hypothetical protein